MRRIWKRFSCRFYVKMPAYMYSTSIMHCVLYLDLSVSVTHACIRAAQPCICIRRRMQAYVEHMFPPPFSFPHTCNAKKKSKLSYSHRARTHTWCRGVEKEKKIKHVLLLLQRHSNHTQVTYLNTPPPHTHTHTHR